MTQTRGKWFLIGSGIAIIAAIGLSIPFIGGPGQARADDRDQIRLRHLDSMTNILECNYRETARFPGMFNINTVHRDCVRMFPDDEEFNDPSTDGVYTYTAFSRKHVEYCATFEATPKRLTRLAGPRDRLDPTTGCYTIERD